MKAINCKETMNPSFIKTFVPDTAKYLRMAL